MFGSLIRRNPARAQSVDESVLDSTTFSLSTAVPRPSERRTDDRVVPMLRVAKLVSTTGEQLIRLRNVSAGGLMGEIGQPVPVGEAVSVELSSADIPGTVVWIREGTIGVKFDQDIDIGELLAGRKQRHGFRARPPRLQVGCKASVKVDKIYYGVEVHDISLGGMKVEPIEEYCVGKKVVVVVESLKPIRGEIRWYSDRRAGIVFDEPLDFQELAEWVGKRLELASLKAAYQKT